MSNLADKLKVHTPNLLNHIEDSLSAGKGQEIAALKIPFGTFRNLLSQVAEVASDIDDPKLNCLMMKMGLYAVADPSSDDYDQKFVNDYLRKHNEKR